MFLSSLSCCSRSFYFQEADFDPGAGAFLDWPVEDNALSIYAVLFGFQVVAALDRVHQTDILQIIGNGEQQFSEVLGRLQVL